MQAWWRSDDRSIIGDAEVREIAEALTVNKTLTELCLSFNDIRAKGTSAIAEALNVNKTLTNLRMEWTFIPDKWTTKIAKALQVNRVLTMLDLYFNPLDGGFRTVIDRLLAMAQLTYRSLRM